MEVRAERERMAEAGVVVRGNEAGGRGTGMEEEEGGGGD